MGSDSRLPRGPSLLAVRAQQSVAQTTRCPLTRLTASQRPVGVWPLGASCPGVGRGVWRGSRQGTRTLRRMPPPPRPVGTGGFTARGVRAAGPGRAPSAEPLSRPSRRPEATAASRPTCSHMREVQCKNTNVPCYRHPRTRRARAGVIAETPPQVLRSVFEKIQQTSAGNKPRPLSLAGVTTSVSRRVSGCSSTPAVSSRCPTPCYA